VGTASGDIQELLFRSESEASLRRELADKGYHVFRVRRSLGVGSLFSAAPFSRERIPASEFILFNQELAALLRAGLPLLQSLDIMLERMKHPLFRRVLTDIRDKVKSGTALSDAFRAQGELFPRMYSASLVAGEKSGNLEQVIRRYLNYQKLTEGTRKKVVAALVYPAFLFVFMLAAVSYLLLVVMPKFSEFFDTFNAELPPLTVALLAVATWVRDHFLAVSLSLLAGSTFLYFWAQGHHARATLDRFLLDIPFVGPVLRLFATSQLTRSLSTLLAGGIPLVQSIDIAARSIGNRFLGETLAPVAERVREGKSFAASLEATGQVSNLTIEMAKVGEATGGLSDMMANVADFCDEEISNRLEIMLSMLTPVVLVVMGGIVAMMLLALYMPLFELAGAASRAGR
jgi:type IV pilus assembly protein PilC